MSETASSASASAVEEILARRPRRARFVVEIGELLRRSGVGSDDIEDALGALEAAGGVIIRSHACADPHLEGADLRIAAIVAVDAGDADPQSAAIAMIEDTWQRWLADYLANHRCM